MIQVSRRKRQYARRHHAKKQHAKKQYAKRHNAKMHRKKGNWQNGHNERSFLRIMACILHSASKLKWYLNETFHLAYLVRCLFGLLGVYYNKFKTELTATAFLSG